MVCVLLFCFKKTFCLSGAPVRHLITNLLQAELITHWPSAVLTFDFHPARRKAKGQKGKERRAVRTIHCSLLILVGCCKGLRACPCQKILICSIKSVGISTVRRLSSCYCVCFSRELVCKTGLQEVRQPVKGCPSRSGGYHKRAGASETWLSCWRPEERASCTRTLQQPKCRFVVY